jgi:hypothetical protein
MECTKVQLDRYLDRDIESPGTITEALIDNLEDDLPYMGRRRWRADDFYGLTFVALLDCSIDSGRFTEGVPEPRRSALLGEVATFHAALPFAENERHLIVNEYDELVFPTGLRDDVINRVYRQKLCIDGIIKATSGRELMRRWWSWRRSIEEYKGGAGLEAARAAIGAIHEHLGRG